MTRRDGPHTHFRPPKGKGTSRKGEERKQQILIKLAANYINSATYRAPTLSTILPASAHSGRGHKDHRPSDFNSGHTLLTGPRGRMAGVKGRRLRVWGGPASWFPDSGFSQDPMCCEPPLAGQKTVSGTTCTFAQRDTSNPAGLTAKPRMPNADRCCHLPLRLMAGLSPLPHL